MHPPNVNQAVHLNDPHIGFWVDSFSTKEQSLRPRKYQEPCRTGFLIFFVKTFIQPPCGCRYLALQGPSCSFICERCMFSILYLQKCTIKNPLLCVDKWKMHWSMAMDRQKKNETIINIFYWMSRFHQNPKCQRYPISSA